MAKAGAGPKKKRWAARTVVKIDFFTLEVYVLTALLPGRQRKKLGGASNPYSMKSHWSLDPGKIFLNHGSYGACPECVLEEQWNLRRQMERAPVHFMARQYPQLLAQVREEMALFLGSEPNNLAFISNATAGINAVLRSLRWNPGDEIVITDHVYEACRNVVIFLTERFGVKVVLAPIPFPGVTIDGVLNAIENSLSVNTQLIMIDHVTSPTGLVFPLERIAQLAADRDIGLLVDGAHAPGLIDLNLEDLGDSGVTYYTGNFHKWCCSPKGAAFLWARPAQQAELHPPVVSHGFRSNLDRSRFLEEFDWCGTFDPTAWLCVPAALKFLESLFPGGWADLRAHGRRLLRTGRAIVSEALPPQDLVDDEFVSQMVSLFLPDTDHIALGERLFDEFQLDTMVTKWQGRTLLRLSAAPYNEIDDYRTLASALTQLREEDYWTN